MARRGNGEGSIYQQRPGLWAAAITVHLSSGGRVRKHYYGKTRRIVQDKLAAATSARQRGAIAIERPTVAEYFERWLSRERRVRTAAAYSSYARNHLVPALGHLHLDEITVHDVADLLQEKLDSGLSTQSVAHIRAVLRAALSEAEREELVFRNVAKIVKLPAPIEQYEGRVLELDEARRFLAAADDDRLAALYRVILPLGLRTGEALALRWEDVDLEARTVHVRHTLQLVRRADRKIRGAGEGLIAMPTKTRRSKQKLPIPETCVRALRSHRARQLEERLAAGAEWRETGYVFTTPRGAPLHAKNVTEESFHQICDRARIHYSTRERQRGPVAERGLRLYDLRHSCASLLIAQGVPLRTVQEILRHTNIRTTADRYTHLVPQVVGDALAMMDRAFLVEAASE